MVTVFGGLSPDQYKSQAHGLSLTYSQSKPCTDLALLSGDLGRAQVPICLCVSSEPNFFKKILFLFIFLIFFNHVPLFLTEKLGS